MMGAWWNNARSDKGVVPWQKARTYKQSGLKSGELLRHINAGERGLVEERCWRRPPGR